MDNALFEKISQYIVQQEHTNCTDWSGRCDPDGYPMISWDSQDRRVSRLVWMLVYGEIPGGLFVCHRCDNPKCLNIAHLFLGTPRENTEDALRKGRMRGPRKVTPELAAQINQLRQEKYTLAEISAKLEVSISTLYNYLRQEVKRTGNYRRGEDNHNWRGGVTPIVDPEKKKLLGAK